MIKKNSLAIIRKTREDYNRIALHFSDTRFDVWEDLKQFKKYIKDNQNILDWGCGNGRLFLMLKNKNIKYFGLDQSEGLIKIAKEKYIKDIKDDKIEFIFISKKDKKFDDCFFDIVFMIASFHHLPDEETRLKLLKKVYKELKNDGKIIITVWNLSSEWAKNKKIKGNIEEYEVGEFFVPWKDVEGKEICKRYYHNFSLDELKKIIKKAGFKIEKAGYSGSKKINNKKNSRNLFVVAKK